MRKGSIEFTTSTFIWLGLALLAAVVVLSLQGKAGEQMTGGAKSASDVMDKMMEFNCKKIDDAGAKDTEKGSATFEEFMAAMKEVYDKCNSGACSGKEVCRTMTLDLGGKGTYYDINLNVLSDRGLDVFNNWLTPNIYCNADNADWGDDEIDVYDVNGKCVETKSFSVAHGSKITVKATKRGSSYIFGSTVDLKVTVKDGEFTTPKAAPLENACPKYPTKDPGNPDADCKPPEWGYCYSGICKNKYYCGWKTPTPSNCYSISTVCPIAASLDGTPCDAQYEYSCSNNPFKTKILRMVDVERTGGKYAPMIQFEVSDGSVAEKFGVLKENEIWLKKQNGKIVLTDENDKDAKLSMYFEKYGSSGPTPNNKDPTPKYFVYLYQGCY